MWVSWFFIFLVLALLSSVLVFSRAPSPGASLAYNLWDRVWRPWCSRAGCPGKVFRWNRQSYGVCCATSPLARGGSQLLLKQKILIRKCHVRWDYHSQIYMRTDVKCFLLCGMGAKSFWHIFASTQVANYTYSLRQFASQVQQNEVFNWGFAPKLNSHLRIYTQIERFCDCTS